MRRALRAGVLITVLASTALVLSSTTGGPGFPALPSVGDISDGLGSSYLSIDGVLEAFGFVAWMLWIYIVATTLLRLLAVVANRYAFPGARGLTRISDTVTPAILRRILDLALGGALLVSAVGGPRAASAHQQVEPPAAVQSLNVEGNGHKVFADIGSQVAQRFDDTYVVRPGDSLWKIAERQLGSGFRWREIYDLNAGNEQADGRRLREPRLIRPGWELLLPHSEQEECDDLSQGVESSPPSIETELPPRQTGQPSEPSIPGPPAANRAEAEPSPTPENRPLAIVERPIRVELPDGAAVPASFAAGVLAASVIGRLRRRRERRVGQRTPLTSPDPVATAATRAGIDPTVDVIGPQSQAVINAWRDSTDEIPRFLAAWENPTGTSFLIDAVPDALPEEVETSAHQRVTFEPEGRHTKALVTGPLVPRLRRGPFTAADGVLVPIGFTDSGVLHVPLIGPELHVSGSESSSFVETLLAFAAMRLGEESIEVWGRDGSRIRERLELEALRRRRLFAEESVYGFTEHVLLNPDDQLAAVVVVLGHEFSGGIADLSSVLTNLGFILIVMSEDQQGPRTILCKEDAAEVRLMQLEPIVVERPRLPEGTVNEISTLGGELAEGEILEESRVVGEKQGVNGQDDRDQTTPGTVEVQEEHAPTADTAAPDGSRKIHTFGGIRVEVQDQEQRKGWRAAALEILAALIAYPDGLSKDQLVSMVWPDCEFSDVQDLFYKSISQIRRNLRTAGDTSKIVTSSRVEDTYRLDLSLIWVDAVSFRQEIKSARAAATPEPHLRRAIELYAGPFLGEKYYSWAEQTREDLRDAFDEACARLAQILEQRGDLVGALDLIDKAIEHDPLSEDLTRRAMTLEAGLGNRQGVIDRFHGLKKTLAKELDLAPSDETHDLFSSLARRSGAAQRS